MRHARSGRKLGRDSAQRRALYANLAGALIEHGRIKTTVTKAKAVKPIAEQLITLGRRGDLHARRQAVAFLRSKDVVHHLFTVVGPRFAERPGGYARIVRLGPRPGDAAEMAFLELVDEPLESTPRRPGRGAVVEDVAAEPEPAEEPDAEAAEPEAETEPSAGEELAEEREATSEASPDAAAADDESQR
jgi:large subunit ribosomal protein L17